MRNAVLLLVLAVVVFLTHSPVVSAATCTATCSGTVALSCTAMTCTGSNGSHITCDGVTTTCGSASGWCACSADCVDQCAGACELSPNACRFCITNCNQNNCGSQPPFISHC